MYATLSMNAILDDYSYFFMTQFVLRFIITILQNKRSQYLALKSETYFFDI